MIGELVQQWAFALRVCAPFVRASEAVEDSIHDAAHDAAEWFELAAGRRLIFALMRLVDAAFDGLDWLLDVITRAWCACVELWEAD